MSLKYLQALTQYQAGAGNIIGATSIVLVSLTDIYGNAITTMATTFGTKGYITCEPDSNNEEAATFTGITVNANGTVSLTGVSTILAQSPYTETSGLARQHSGGTKVVITDNVAFWNTFGNTANTNTWADVQTFSVPAVQATDPTSSSQVANKHYVDNVAVAGAPNASPTVKGIVQEATQAQVLSKTSAGSTGAELYVNPSTLTSTLLSDYKVDTGAANAYVITPAPAITAYTVGQIFSFKAVNANTTASTLNVNALGVKTIKNSLGGDIVANDILAGQIVVVEFDGTNLQMISPLGNQTAQALKSASTVVSVSAATAPSSGQVLKATSSTTATWQTPATTCAKGTATKNMVDGSTTQNIAHGLGTTPSSFRVFGISPVVSNFAMCFSGNSLSQGTTSAYPSTSFVLETTSGNKQTAVITADATNIILTWTEGGAPSGTANLIWEAFI